MDESSGITLYNLTHFTTCFGNLSADVSMFYIFRKLACVCSYRDFFRADLDYTSTTVKPLLVKNSEDEHLLF